MDLFLATPTTIPRRQPMSQGKCSIEIAATAQTVFDLIHDYEIRLKWDTMLSEARLLDGATKATSDARSRCVGNWKCLWLPIEATYVTFENGKVAAVKMTNRPLFFERFAATIRHDDLENGRSRVTYIYSFASKPRWLSLFQEPIMKLCLTREVKHRLRALKAFAEAKTENS